MADRPIPGEAHALDGVLTDLIALALFAKQAHWNLAGPTFGPLHAMLDDLADLAREAGDSVAERAATLGHHPDGRPQVVAQGHDLPELDAGGIRDNEAVDIFDAVLGAVVGRLRRAIVDTGDDPVTQDLLISHTAELEKRRWMFRAHR